MRKLLIAAGIFCGGNAVAQCAFTPSATIIQPSCFGAANGQFTVNVTGGTGPFNYQLGTGPVLSTSTFTGLFAGVYSVTVIDLGDASCSETFNVTIGTPTPVTITPSVVSPPCAGSCTGSITLSVTGGTPPYAYNWSPPSGFASTAGSLCPGTYTYTVTDANGCISSGMSTVTSPPPFTVTASSTPAGCGGACTGTLSVSGSGSFTASWSPVASLSCGTCLSPTGACAGVTYTVTATNMSGCVATSSVSVGTTTPPSASATVTPASCGACDGVISVTATSGVSPYTYSLDGGAYVSSSVFTGLCSGSHSVVVQDAVGCMTTLTEDTSPAGIASLSVSPSVFNEVPGLANGKILLGVTGGTPPLTFSWSNGATTQNIYSLTAGMYSVTITDATGNCNAYTYAVNPDPGFGVISGVVFVDANGNCLPDGGETLPTSVTVNAASSFTYTTYTSAGYYSFYLPNNSYTLTTVLPLYLTTSSVCPGPYTATVSSGSSSVVYIPVEASGPFTDGTVVMHSSGIHPGFPGADYITVCNAGTVSIDGVLTVVIPDSTTLTGSTPAYDNVSGDTVSFNISGLAPGGCLSFNVDFTCPADPSLLGDIATAYAWLTVTSDVDVAPVNNSAHIDVIINGSYDPNQKSVTPCGDVLMSDSLFTYFIEFQNTGNAPAINIVVRDTLSDFLDYNTIELLGTSHPSTFTLVDNKIMQWSFNGIMLVDSTTDEPNSHGWILFRIERKNTVALGDSIQNTADIYFDFNPPVITNTTSNLFVLPPPPPPTQTTEEQTVHANGFSTGAGVEENALQKAMVVYPNPANSQLNVSLNGFEGATVSVTDVNGRRVYSAEAKTNHLVIPVGSLEKGIYFVNCISNGKTAVSKFVKN